MTEPGEMWSSFTHDPRCRENASLRASDRDRDVVHQALADAYSDGRLDRAEFDTRTTEAASARTLGELPALVGDLVPAASTPALRPGGAILTDTQIQERAVAKWASDRRQALWGFLSASLICWVIWFATGYPEAIPWPLFVMLGTGLNVGRMQFQRQELVAAERRGLEKKQRKQLEQPREKEGEAE